MCIDLLLGSTGQLPLGQHGEKCAKFEGRRIFVTDYNGKAKSRDAQAIFPTRFLYWVRNTHTGDGCGFCGNYSEANADRQELAAFLERSLELVADLQLYVAYHDFGNSGGLPSKLADIGPSDIRTWMTGFYADEYFQVIRED